MVNGKRKKEGYYAQIKPDKRNEKIVWSKILINGRICRFFSL
jgi:hypothetical protein